ncbi:hypothetical protein SteCoe_6080 [Stentor coeruleus]|uniref:Uncharacterized protein n=1 Tax=Stentor coeruleus TaxID=5963 RepID=A0A1R2CQW4_9CILI|nr:hypothetical protein SteCoe_6080 [Stentor coeruleus]
MEPAAKVENITSQETIESLTKEIAELETQRKSLEAAEKILEAGKTNKRIEKLKSQLSEKRKQEKQSKMLQDKKTLDEAHSAEITNFNSIWLEKKNKLMEDLQKEEEKIKNKQKEEKVKTKEELLKTFPEKAKPDPKFLQLKQLKYALMKSKQYEKAYEVEQQMKDNETQRQQKWEDTKNEKITLEMEKLEKAFKKELVGFNKKKTLELFEFERKKNMEFNHLNKRYTNTASDMALSQKTLKYRLSSMPIKEPKVRSKAASNKTGSTNIRIRIMIA